MEHVQSNIQRECPGAEIFREEPVVAEPELQRHRKAKRVVKNE